jgi:autophagy-related protein 9
MQNGSLWDLWSFVFVVGIWCFLASRLHGEILSTSRNSIVGARAIQRFYATELRIQDGELRYMGWDAVVEKIVARKVTVKQHDAADIANRIMRKDNYLIALMHNDILPLKLPSLPFPSPVPQACIPVSLRPWIQMPDFVAMPTPPKYFSWTLERSVRFCLLDKMFDEQFKMPQAFTDAKGAEGLQNRFRWVGLMIFCLSPFIVAGISMYLFLKHADTFYKSPHFVVERRWSHTARWKFRDFNEMEGAFRRRVKRAEKPAEEYLAQFPSDLVQIAARFLTFVGGSFAAICLAIMLINDSLMATTFYGHSLWWYGAICGSSLAITRSVARMSPCAEHALDPAACFAEVARLAHNLPPEWAAKAGSREVCSEFKRDYFPSRMTVVLQEMVGVLLTPLKLWTIYPRDAVKILQFIRENTEECDNIGSVCGFATFDFEKYGDRAYGAGREFTVNSRPSLPHGKMEKSFVNFVAAHPSSWDPTNAPGGAALDASCRSSAAVEAAPAAPPEPLLAMPSQAGGQSLFDSVDMMAPAESTMQTPGRFHAGAMGGSILAPAPGPAMPRAAEGGDLNASERAEAWRHDMGMHRLESLHQRTL